MSDWHNRIKHLEEAHRMINKKVDTLEKTGVYDDVEIETLKKQRLQVKDQIEELKLKHVNK